MLVLAGWMQPSHRRVRLPASDLARAFVGRGSTAAFSDCRDHTSGGLLWVFGSVYLDWRAGVTVMLVSVLCTPLDVQNIPRYRVAAEYTCR